MKSKQTLRPQALERLKHFSGNARERQEHDLLAQLVANPVYQAAKLVGIFMPLGFENQLPLSLVTQSDKSFAIPKVLNDHEMMFTAYHPNLTLESSRLGVLESDQTQAVYPDLIIVPALAWRADGYRIGFGKGYYDRYLRQYPAQTIGLAFDFQVIDFQVEAHDKKVDLLITYETKTQ